MRVGAHAIRLDTTRKTRKSEVWWMGGGLSVSDRVQRSYGGRHMR